MTPRVAWFRLATGVILALAAVWFSLTHEAQKRSVFDGEIPQTDPRVASFNLVKAELSSQEWVGLIIQTQTSILDQRVLGVVRSVTENFQTVPKVVPETIRSLTTVKVVVPGEALDTDLLVSPTDLADGRWPDRIRTRLSDNPLLKRELVARDERATLVGAYIAPGFAQAAVAHDLQRMAKAFAQPDIDIMPVGNIIANQAMDEGIEEQSTLFVGIALLVLLVLFAWLRMLWAGTLAVLLLVVSLVELKAYQILLNLPDSVVLSATPLLIVALGVSYFYYLARAAAMQGIAGARRELAKSTWFSIVATVYGFGTLYTFQILSIREFGLVTAIGIVTVGFNVWFVYAAALILWPRLIPAASYRAKAPFELITTRLLRWSLRPLALVVVVAMVILGQMGRDPQRLRTNTDPFRFFPADHVVVRGLHALEQFGGNSELVIAIRPRAGSSGKVRWTPALLEELLALEERLKRIPKVGDGAGLASLADATYAKYDPAAHEVQRFPTESVGLLINVVAADELDRVLSLDRQTTFIRVWATAWTTDEVKVILHQIHRELEPFWQKGYRDIACDGLGPAPFVALGGFDTLWIALSEYVVEGKMANFFWGVLLMPLVALPFIGSGGYGWRGRILRSLIVTVPLAAALHETLGVMGWLGIQLDLASCVITSIGFGVGEDFAIHLLHYHDRHGSFVGAASENAELLMYAFLTALTFAPFSLSVFLPLRQFAFLVIVILGFSYLNAMLLVPQGVQVAQFLLGRKVST